MRAPSPRVVMSAVSVCMVLSGLGFAVDTFSQRQAAEINAIRDQTLAYQEDVASRQEAIDRANEARAARQAAAEKAADRANDARAARRAAAEETADSEEPSEGGSSETPTESPEPTATTAPIPSPEVAVPEQHVITGEIVVPDINGALVTQVGGYPGQPLTELSKARLDKMGRLLHSLREGRTYPCPAGSGGGYADLAVGTQVVVEDGEGRVLATSSLSGGTIGVRGCTLDFKTSAPDADFYRVTISHRGALTYSRGDLDKADWKVFAEL